MADHIKILLEYEGSAPTDREIESVWAFPVEGGYQIDNIPFYAREIALGDVVSTTKDIDGSLRFSSLVRPSGHSTVRLWFAKDRVEDVALVRQKLREMKCASEQSDLPRLVAIDIPPSVSYESALKLFVEGEKAGLFEYEEACLGANAIDSNR